MIGQELYRGNQRMRMTSSLEFRHHISKVWLEPFLGRVTRALVAEHPAFRCQTSKVCHSSSRFLAAANIVWFLLYHPFRPTVRGEEHRHALSYFPWATLQARLNAH